MRVDSTQPPSQTHSAAQSTQAEPMLPKPSNLGFYCWIAGGKHFTQFSSPVAVAKDPCSSRQVYLDREKNFPSYTQSGWTLHLEPAQTLSSALSLFVRSSHSAQYICGQEEFEQNWRQFLFGPSSKCSQTLGQLVRRNVALEMFKSVSTVTHIKANRMIW